MTEEKQVNELAWKTRIHYDTMMDRGFEPGQITIMNIMISISQYSQEKGPGAAIALMTACLNAIMSGGEVDITKINGFKNTKFRKIEEDEYENEEEDLEIEFESEMDLNFGSVDDTEYIKEENVVFVDFTQKDED